MQGGKVAYWAARKAREKAVRSWATGARYRADLTLRCRKCGRPLTHVGDSYYCLAPITGPDSCPDAYTD